MTHPEEENLRSDAVDGSGTGRGRGSRQEELDEGEAEAAARAENASGSARTAEGWSNRNGRARYKGDPRVLPARRIEDRMIHQDALRVVSRLDRNGFEAYLVGGCVRDILLGRAAKDFDVATEAHPRQIKRLFRNARIIGRRFKLAHIIYGPHIVETATFRKKPPQEDDETDLLILEDNEFGTAEEDARRRDFTINGLFLDPLRQQILDYVGGLEDLEAGVLRTIGPPMVRMAEDPVRILRAIKFATRLGFRIDEETWQAMCHHAFALERAAPPRVMEEIMRLMRSGTALGAVRMMRACGALRVLLPEIDEYIGSKEDPDPAVHDRADAYWRLLEALDSLVHEGIEPSRPLCLAVIYLRIAEREAELLSQVASHSDLHVIASNLLDQRVRRARLPRREAAQACRIIANQARFTALKPKGDRPIVFLRSEDFPESLHLFRLRSAARGQGWDIYQAWEESYRDALDLDEEELARLRRRRRRRRRRKKPE